MGRGARLGWAGRWAALIMLLGLLLAGLPPSPADAAEGDGVGAAAPREGRQVEVRRGGRVGRVRPLRTVKTADGREAAAERLLVRFRDGLSAAERADVHRAAAARAGMSGRPLAATAADSEVVDAAGAPSLEAAVAAYRADARVTSAEPNYIVRRTAVPNDPEFSRQWAMQRIQAPAAWDISRGSPSRRIAVLDCGIYEIGSSAQQGDPGHPDLNGRIVGRRDFSDSPFGTDDFCDHGTHTAGIASAITNNGRGVAGLGYSTSLLNVKVLDDQGIGDVSWVAAGIRWAADNGANVINMSLSGVGACPVELQAAVDYAWGRQVVLVAAAGNNDSSRPEFPANCDNVVAVASTDINDTRSSFSNFGPWVDVAAPGGTTFGQGQASDILSTDFIGGYGYKSGTSEAAPHVAGLAALLWATGSYGSAAAIVDRIGATADRIPGSGSFWRTGRINAAAALAPPPAPVDVDGGHVVLGATSPATTWLFAEGYTGAGFDEYLTIQNPGATTADVGITYYLAGGGTEARSRDVPPRSRVTIAVHDATDGIGRGKAHATRLDSRNGVPIVVERPIYFNYAGGITDGHATLGATAPGRDWYFAEGFTGPGFDEFLTIANPGGAGSATITYYVEGQANPTVRSVPLPAGSRTTVTVHLPQGASNPGGLGRLPVGHATRVQTTVDTVVERPLYFTYSADINGGHIVLGATRPSKVWYFAEGYTAPGFDEYLTIQNPQPTAGTATITYYLEGRSVPEVRSVPLPASSRTTVAVHLPTGSGNPGGLGRLGAGHATRVETSVETVIERPTYFAYADINGGSNVLGATAPGRDWYFAEGFTGGRFDEFLTIANPGGAGTATITYFVEGQATPTVRSVPLPASSRTTVAVHVPAGPGNPGGLGRLTVGHATRVQTTVDTVVERPSYFVYRLG